MTFLDVAVPTYTRVTTAGPLRDQSTPSTYIDPMIFIVPIVVGLIAFAVISTIVMIRKNKIKLQNHIISE